MSTDHPPLDDLDLSNLLDGEASAEVEARLARDPAARDRLAQLRAVRDLVAAADVDPLPEDTVDDLIDVALAAADATEVDATEPGPLADVVPVPPSRRRGGVPPWVVAAVVVVLVGLGLSLVWMGRDSADSGSGDDIALEADAAEITTGGAEESQLAGSGGADAAESGATELAPDLPATDDEVSSTTTGLVGAAPGAPTLVNLGEFDDPDALREHLRDGFPADAETGSLPETGIPDDLTAAFRCLGKVDGLFEPLGEPTDVGLAIVEGDPTVVYDMPYRTDEGRDTTLVIAVDEVTCVPVLAFQR